MREIKFRAWLPNEEKMFYQNEQYLESFLKRANNFETKFKKEHPKYNSKVLCQYTGLRDKNGKEIYEGDIVNILVCNKSWKNRNFTIGYELGGFSLQIEGESPVSLGYYFWGLVENNKASSYKHCDGSFFEITGNIHENPELLK
jgi:uncharacterized phage protein (TIGR01671 family)